MILGKITDEQRESIIKLYNDGVSYREIADTLNNTFNTTNLYYEGVRSVCRQFRKKRDLDNAEKQVEKNHSGVKCSLEFGVTPERKINKKKTLILNDLHIPYMREDVYDVLLRHKKEIDTIVFGGDFLDMACVSSFSAMNKPTIEEELVSGLETLEKMRYIVGTNVKMIFIYGNHEFRLERYICNLQQKELSTFLNPKVLEHLRDGFTMYKNGKKIEYKGISDLIIVNSWYVNINNSLIVVHPTNFHKPFGANAKTAIEYFIDKGEDFDAVIVAHNHHAALVPSYFNKLGLETGCLCKPMEYSEKKTSNRNQDYGYCLISFDDNGKVDKDKVELHQLRKETITYDNHISL